MNRCFFINDNNVDVLLPNHEYSNLLSHRVNSEKYFRQLHIFLINNNLIDINKNVIDLGSYIGDNSIPWSKIFNGKIYAIDPSPKNGEFINLVKEINNLQNLIFIEKAISNKTKFISTDDELHHCMFNEKKEGKYTIESCSLDDLEKKNIISNIGYIHLDVEGMEGLVLEGSKKIIDTYRPVITFEQHINTDDYIGVSNFLKLKDYTVFLIDESFEGCRPDCRNLLALPKEKINSEFVYDVNIFIKNNLLSII
jgi:FkbM family methyltransferase